jgi:hypothetical protein
MISCGGLLNNASFSWSDRHDIPQLTSTMSTDAPNAASIRVMERLGMQFEKRLAKAGLDTLYYRLRRSR